MNRKKAAAILTNLDCAVRGFTASDYKDSIDTSGFLKLEGDSVSVDWDRVETFAHEVAIRVLMEYGD